MFSDYHQFRSTSQWGFTPRTTSFRLVEDSKRMCNQAALFKSNIAKDYTGSVLNGSTPKPARKGAMLVWSHFANYKNKKCNLLRLKILVVTTEPVQSETSWNSYKNCRAHSHKGTSFSPSLTSCQMTLSPTLPPSTNPHPLPSQPCHRHSRRS